MNVAVGIARLGVPAAFLGGLSSDRFGRLLRSHLMGSGVDLRHVHESDRPTALAIVETRTGGEPGFTFHGEGTADRDPTPDGLPRGFPDASVGALHAGSISLLREPGAAVIEQIMTAARAAEVLVSLDPNVRASLAGDPTSYATRLRRWLATADLVKVSRADLAWIAPGSDPEAVAEEWIDHGPRLVVVTLGDDGAVALDGRRRVAVEATQVSVADTVGAGDAFTSGLLVWLHEHDVLAPRELENLDADQLTEMLRFGAGVAALTCARRGAEPPWRAELDAASAEDR